MLLSVVLSSLFALECFLGQFRGLFALGAFFVLCPHPFLRARDCVDLFVFGHWTFNSYASVSFTSCLRRVHNPFPIASSLVFFFLSFSFLWTLV